MGFITPSPPPFEVDEWKQKSHLDRIKPLAQDWGINGFGTPWAIYLVYLFKCVIFIGGGLALIGATTEGLGGIGSIDEWWNQPIVFQKLIVLAMLWEVVGLGAGSMPLTFRFSPPIGGILYWTRPGTIRQPPFPNRVPLTAGSNRTPIDALLYVGLIGTLGYLLVTDGEAVAGLTAGRLDPAVVGLALGFLVLIGLRDKLIYLAARTEMYGILLVVFLFPLENLIVGSQFVFFAIWMGAAASKLNRHFPFVVSVMIANTPWNRSKSFKKKLWRDYPDDMRPSNLSAMAAHGATVTEFSLPIILILSDGGLIGWLAVAGMVAFHTHIFSTFPLAVPLEWNLIMIWGLFYLFGENGDVALSTLDDPLLIAILLVSLLALPIYGNLRPDKVSFLTSMRYYAGNWATSQWAFRKDTEAEEKFDQRMPKFAPVVVKQLEKLYDREMAEVMLTKGLAFRSMHSHGRAINALWDRGLERIDDYDLREGELIAGISCGYNFGDGHFHNEQLIEAVQEHCQFEPGDLVVVMLESQPFHRNTQEYRIVDAAAGLIERGTIDVRDVVDRQPWLEGDYSFPVEVLDGGRPKAGAPAGAGPTDPGTG